MSRSLIINSGARGFEEHPRTWRDFKWCYPVISRRSRGLSLGINLNPDRICNFDCIYCEVDRHDFRPGKSRLPLPPLNRIKPLVDLDEIKQELDWLLKFTRSGQIWQEPEFNQAAPELWRLNDIAFSGDGEPTTYGRFDEAVGAAIAARDEAGYAPYEVKLVLITNATQLHRARVQAGINTLLANNGEIWAKLDAGTPQYYLMIDKTNVPYERILQNLTQAAQSYPLNIQTCMLRAHGAGPSPTEIEAYCQRLNDIRAAGGKLLAVQLYTVARRPPNEWVSSLPLAELERISATIQDRTGLPVETFGGNIGL